MSTFETLPNPTQVPGQITFDESKFKLRSRRILGQPEVPTMIRFLVTKGLVKTEGQAVGILLGICVLLVVATIFVFKSTGTEPATLDPAIMEISS